MRGGADMQRAMVMLTAQLQPFVREASLQAWRVSRAATAAPCTQS